MKILISLLLSLFVLGIFSACSLMAKKAPMELPVDPQTKALLEQKLKIAEDLLEEQKFLPAAEKFSTFEILNPQSIYLNRSKIGHARALTGDGKNNAAIALYGEVIDSSLGLRPELVALASYYSSFCYEALGDAPKTYASLMDAKNLEKNLPAEIAQAELPARLAAYYNREGDSESAKKYFHQAERGIAVVFADDSAKSRMAKARTFYLMGQLSSNQLSIENMQSQLDSLSMMQIFLLRSIELNDPVWSALALKNIQGNYKDLWNTILQIPKNKALDAFAAEQEQHEAQVHALGQILDLIQRLKVYSEPVDRPDNQFGHELFVFLSQLEEHAQQMLASAGSLPLTPEAQKRQSLHQEGTIRQAPTPELPHGDPNLQGH